MGQFVCCWFIKLEYDNSCIFYTMHIFDALLFLLWSVYSLGGLGAYRAWPHIIFLIFCICLLIMGIWAIVIIFKKEGPKFSREKYVKYRLWVIIGLIIAAVIFFILWIIYGAAAKVSSGVWVGGGIYAALPLLIDAAVLHGYHSNFVGNKYSA